MNIKNKKIFFSLYFFFFSISLFGMRRKGEILHPLRESFVFRAVKTILEMDNDLYGVVLDQCLDPYCCESKMIEKLRIICLELFSNGFMNCSSRFIRPFKRVVSAYVSLFFLDEDLFDYVIKQCAKNRERVFFEKDDLVLGQLLSFEIIDRDRDVSCGGFLKIEQDVRVVAKSLYKCFQEFGFSRTNDVECELSDELFESSGELFSSYFESSGEDSEELYEDLLVSLDELYEELFDIELEDIVVDSPTLNVSVERMTAVSKLSINPFN